MQLAEALSAHSQSPVCESSHWRPVFSLADLAALAVADGADQPVAGLVTVELGQDGSTLALVVDVAEQVQTFDPTFPDASSCRRNRAPPPILR